MALRRGAPDQFRGRRDFAGSLSVDLKAAGGAAVGPAGPSFAPGLLRAPAFLLCWVDPAGKRGDAERMGAIGAAGDHPGGHAPDGPAVLEIGSEERRQIRRSTKYEWPRHFGVPTGDRHRPGAPTRNSHAPRAETGDFGEINFGSNLSHLPGTPSSVLLVYGCASHTPISCFQLIRALGGVAAPQGDPHRSCPI